MKKIKKLSIIIPVYNEENTVEKVLDMVSAVKVTLEKEIIIINDGSTDNSLGIVKNYKKNKNKNLVIISKKNGGKGSAVVTGFRKATGDIFIIQDADMEYDPDEYQSLINPIISGKYKVVYGSRRLGKVKNKYSGLKFYLGGLLLTWYMNILFLSNMTDEPTCYKVFRRDVIDNIKIYGKKFDWEPEVTAKILKKRIKIHEVPISYHPRSIKEGKKINYKDFIHAVWTALKYRFVD